MSDVYLLSCATNPYQFESSIFTTLGTKMGYNVIFCGVNEKWNGYVTKINCLHEALKKLDQDKLCVIADAYDVLPVRKADTLTSDYQKVNREIIVGAETNCGSNCRPLVNYFIGNQTGIFNYVNSGLILGRVARLNAMFSNYIVNQYTDDQLALSQYIDSNVELFYVDINAKFFMNTVVVDNVVTQNENIVEDRFLSGALQYFVHFPGLNAHESQQINYKDSLQKVLNTNNMKNVVSLRNPRALTGTGLFLVLVLVLWAVIATAFAFYFYNQLIKSTKI